MSGGQCLTLLSEQCSSSTQESPCDAWCGHRLLNIQTSHVLHLLRQVLNILDRVTIYNIQYQSIYSVKNDMVIGDHLQIS